jgi:UDP:flavonoid glycosyltransferase YjiC (YdhE family)
MHGMVHALKQGVPAVAVDPIRRGAKIRHQAEAVGWPVVLTADELSEKALHEALDYCLAPEASDAAHSRAKRAAKLLQATRTEFVGALRDGHR